MFISLITESFIIRMNTEVQMDEKEMQVAKSKRAHHKQMLAALPGGIQATARARVGGDDLARLAWLLDLLNRPTEGFAVISERDRADLEAEIVAFCDPVGSVVGGQASQLSIRAAQKLVSEIREGLLAMLKGATFDFKIPEVTMLLIPASGCSYMGGPEALFRLAIAKLLEVERQRIRVCARSGCGKMFVRRKRALYCGKICSQMEQFARFIARHATEGARRRAH
jgi:hypothetical protein